MTKWSYRIVNFYNETPDGMENGLNRLGEQGWELVQLLQEADANPENLAKKRWGVLKRPLSE